MSDRLRALHEEHSTIHKRELALTESLQTHTESLAEANAEIQRIERLIQEKQELQKELIENKIERDQKLTEVSAQKADVASQIAQEEQKIKENIKSALIKLIEEAKPLILSGAISLDPFYGKSMEEQTAGLILAILKHNRENTETNDESVTPETVILEEAIPKIVTKPNLPTPLVTFKHNSSLYSPTAHYNRYSLTGSVPAQKKVDFSIDEYVEASEIDTTKEAVDVIEEVYTDTNSNTDTVDVDINTSFDNIEDDPAESYLKNESEETEIEEFENIALDNLYEPVIEIKPDLKNTQDTQNLASLNLKLEQLHNIESNSGNTATMVRDIIIAAIQDLDLSGKILPDEIRQIIYDEWEPQFQSELYEVFSSISELAPGFPKDLYLNQLEKLSISPNQDLIESTLVENNIVENEDIKPISTENSNIIISDSQAVNTSNGTIQADKLPESNSNISAIEQIDSPEKVSDVIYHELTADEIADYAGKIPCFDAYASDLKWVYDPESKQNITFSESLSYSIPCAEALVYLRENYNTGSENKANFSVETETTNNLVPKIDRVKISGVTFDISTEGNIGNLPKALKQAFPRNIDNSKVYLPIVAYIDAAIKLNIFLTRYQDYFSKPENLILLQTIFKENQTLDNILSKIIYEIKADALFAALNSGSTKIMTETLQVLVDRKNKRFQPRFDFAKADLNIKPMQLVKELENDLVNALEGEQSSFDIVDLIEIFLKRSQKLSGEDVQITEKVYYKKSLPQHLFPFLAALIKYKNIDKAKFLANLDNKISHRVKTLGGNSLGKDKIRTTMRKLYRYFTSDKETLLNQMIPATSSKWLEETQITVLNSTNFVIADYSSITLDPRNADKVDREIFQVIGDFKDKTALWHIPIASASNESLLYIFTSLVKIIEIFQNKEISETAGIEYLGGITNPKFSKFIMGFCKKNQIELIAEERVQGYYHLEIPIHSLLGAEDRIRKIFVKTFLKTNKKIPVNYADLEVLNTIEV